MNTSLRSCRASFQTAWHAFFHAPVSTELCAILRTGFGLLILLNFALVYPDVEKWFGPQGMITFPASRAIISPDMRTLFEWFPQSHTAVWVLYALLLLQSFLLAVGFHGRFQAACVFVLLTAFHDRNIAWTDGEDTLMRLACFFLIFMPLDESFSLRNLLSPNRKGRHRPHPVWPLRLLQIEMCLIYLSTAVLKFQGTGWRDGSAMYYVSRLEQFRRFPLPGFLMENYALSQAATWAVLALEFALPFALWVPRWRRAAITAGVLLHLAIEYSMSLWLFEWTMIMGLLSFLPLRPSSGNAVSSPVLGSQPPAA